MLHSFCLSTICLSAFLDHKMMSYCYSSCCSCMGIGQPLQYR